MELWTVAHGKTVLPALVVTIAAACILRKVMGKKPLSVRMIPLQIIAVALVVLEIGKQTLSLARGYDLYNLPLHVCSLFIFAMPAMAFYKGRHKETVGAVTSALCAAVFGLMLIYPNLIYSAGNIRDFFRGYMDFHTVAFHNLVMFAFVLILALDLHSPGQQRKTGAVAVFTACYSAVAATAAQILKTNYANFYRCNIPVLEDLRITVQGVLGKSLTQLLYILIVASLQILFICGAYRVYCLLHGRITKAKTEPEATKV